MKIKRGYRHIVVIVMIILFAFTILVSLLFGATQIPPKLVWHAIANRISPQWIVPERVDTIVWRVRIPRVFLGALVGLLLAISGTILQGVLRNPLADPYILGVSAGGGIGAAIAIILGGGITLLGMGLIPLLAFLFALAAVLIVYRLSHVAGRTAPETLILAGVAVSAFSSAILALLIILSGKLQSIFFWLLGSLANASWTDVFAVVPYALVGIFIAYFYSKDLNAMIFGEDLAKTLGVNVEKSRRLLLVVASLMAAAAVSVSGLIGFIGLIIPHFVRIIVGPNYRLLIPLAGISGMIFMLVADVLARTILAPMEIPIGIIMALVGAPFFLYILRRRRMKRHS